MLNNRRINAGLPWLRVTTSLLLFSTNGWPKVARYGAVACLTRLSSVPSLVLLLVTMIGVHFDWTLEQGQFAWLYSIVFPGLLVTGLGCYSFDERLFGHRPVPVPGAALR